MSVQLLSGAVAYNAGALVQFQQEIESWGRVSPNPITIQCPQRGCPVQYRLFVPIDAFNAEIQYYENALAKILQGSCPYHSARIRLKPPDSSGY
jgi:hypothetical protein